MTLDLVFSYSKHSDVLVTFVGANFMKEAEIDAMWAEILRQYPAGVDILINNAGI